MLQVINVHLCIHIYVVVENLYMGMFSIRYLDFPWRKQFLRTQTNYHLWLKIHFSQIITIFFT